MKELEALIIGSCFGEDKYKMVSFLEPYDFTNYPGKPYRYFFEILKKANAESLCLVECISKTKHEGLRDLLVSQIHSLGANHPDMLGLKLLEGRFKTLLSSLLIQLSINSKKTVETELLNEATMLVIRKDVFELSDHLLEYLGVHASQTTVSRIVAFLDYRNKRVANAKKVINGIR